MALVLQFASATTIRTLTCRCFYFTALAISNFFWILATRAFLAVLCNCAVATLACATLFGRLHDLLFFSNPLTEINSFSML